MRVIVCGSRETGRNPNKVRKQVADRLFDLPVDSTIVVGYNPATDTPKGIDRFAYQEAQKLGLRVEPHPAKWDLYGKAAGHIRNQEMADSGADLCIAFWNGRSTGTKSMMDKAEGAGIEVERVKVEA